MATGYDPREPWSPMTVALTPNVGTLPEAKLPPLRGPGPERETLRLPLMKLRSMIDNRFHNGKCVAIGDLIELPADEARGWIALRWAQLA